LTTSDIAIPPWIGVSIAILMCGAAIWKGEWPERTVGVMFLLGYAGTVLLRDHSFDSPQWGDFAVTLVNLAVYTTVALRSERQWVLCATGFQLLAVVTHGARILDPSVGDWAYITAGVVRGYLIITALAIGVWGCVRRHRGP